MKGELDLGALLAKRATVHAAGLRARPAAQKAEIVAETVLAVWPLIESGAVRPVIDRVLTLDDVVEAHRARRVQRAHRQGAAARELAQRGQAGEQLVDLGDRWCAA